MTTSRGTERLQDLRYTYDPAGNITEIRDAAQQTIYFNNAVVEPNNQFTYDSIYRLVSAASREHVGQLAQPAPSWDDRFRVHLPHPGDGHAMRRYTEHYDYDEVGNLLALIHRASNGNWTRHYAYEESSLIEPSKHNNRLSSTEVGGVNEQYAYDSHGNRVNMPHLAAMVWGFTDELRSVDLGGGGSAHYVYDSSGQRVRKIIEKNDGALIEERVYLGAFEVYSEKLNDATTLERETLHVMDDARRFALLETRTQGTDGSPESLIR